MSNGLPFEVRIDHNPVFPIGPAAPEVPLDRCYALRDHYNCGHMNPPPDLSGYHDPGVGRVFRREDCIACAERRRYIGMSGPCINPVPVERRIHADCPDCFMKRSGLGILAASTDDEAFQRAALLQYYGHVYEAAQAADVLQYALSDPVRLEAAQTLLQLAHPSTPQQGGPDQPNEGSQNTPQQGNPDLPLPHWGSGPRVP